MAAQGFKEGFTQEQIVSGSVTGDLGGWGVQSPWAKSPVSLALGTEYRQEELELKTSRDFQINDLAGQGGATLSPWFRCRASTWPKASAKSVSRSWKACPSLKI